MLIKKIIFVFFLLHNCLLEVKSQSLTNEVVNSSIYLNLLKVDKCVNKLFEAVAEKKGKSKDFFYEVTLSKRDSIPELFLTESKFSKSFSKDYFGYFKIGKRYFLCKGIQIPGVFEKSERVKKIKISVPIVYNYDELDVELEIGSNREIFTGIMKSCEGTEIIVQVLLSHKIPRLMLKY